MVQVGSGHKSGQVDLQKTWVRSRVNPFFASGQKNRVQIKYFQGQVGLENFDPFCHVQSQASSPFSLFLSKSQALYFNWLFSFLYRKAIKRCVKIIKQYNLSFLIVDVAYFQIVFSYMVAPPQLQKKASAIIYGI